MRHKHVKSPALASMSNSTLSSASNWDTSSVSATKSQDGGSGLSANLLSRVTAVLRQFRLHHSLNSSDSLTPSEKSTDLEATTTKSTKSKNSKSTKAANPTKAGNSESPKEEKPKSKKESQTSQSHNSKLQKSLKHLKQSKKTDSDGSKPLFNSNSKPRKSQDQDEWNDTKSANISLTFNSDRKPAQPAFYLPYWTPESIKMGLKSKTLFKGNVRMTRIYAGDAFVVTENDEQFIIKSDRDRNRAIDGDSVAVLPIADESDLIDQAFILKRYQEALARNSLSLSGNSSEARVETPKDEIKGEKKLNFPESDDPQTFLDDNVSSLKQAIVVGIIHRQQPLSNIAVKLIDRAVSPPSPGSTNTNNNNKKNFTLWAQPVDRRLPLISISHKSAIRLLNLLPNTPTSEIVKHATNKVFVTEDLEWNEQHRNPAASLNRCIGETGDIKLEHELIICTYGVRDVEFDKETIIDQLPTSQTFKPDLESRRDFRDQVVVSIDPETARDLDDAISCKRLDNGNYEIGVHIADVSYFLHEDSALDAEARKRATTVYLVDRAVPMLPPVLCEQLCSLHEGVDRLTMSVVWEITESGDIVSEFPWFGEGVIRSCARFSYSEAQSLLDGVPWSEAIGRQIPAFKSRKFSSDEVIASLNVLNKITKKMRAERMDKGSLNINAPQLKFALDEANRPCKAVLYERKDTNDLIEEMMLLANKAVAIRISQDPRFYSECILRRHRPPKQTEIAKFAVYARAFGIFIDASSSKAFQKSLDDLKNTKNGSKCMEVLHAHAVRAMNRAEYFCPLTAPDPETWSHYALAFSHYTHFTSPIRRYADVVVHRALKSALVREGNSQAQTQNQTFTISNASAFVPEAESQEEEAEEMPVPAIARHCNERKESAKLAGDRSSFVFLSAYINDRCKELGKKVPFEGLEFDAKVVMVDEKFIQVVIPEFGLERVVYLDKDRNFNVSRARFSKDGGARLLEIEFKTRAQIEEAQSRLDSELDSKEALETLETSETVGAFKADMALQVFDDVQVYLYADFSISPCEIKAGLVNSNGK